MGHATDILLITHLCMPRDTGDPRVYEPLRLQVDGRMATLPLLRALAADGGGGEAAPAAAAAPPPPPRRAGGPPVLTPVYLQDYMARRGLKLLNVPCFDTGREAVREALAAGVGLVALSTTWMPGAGDARIVRQVAAELKAMAPDVPLVAGGVGVRKGVRSVDLLGQGRLPGVTREMLADYYLLVDGARDTDLDAVIVSEGGEETLAAMAQRLRDGQPFLDLPNLALPGPEGYRYTPTRPEVSDLDGECVDWSRYPEQVRMAEACVRTATGCPFACEFCDFTGLYRPRLRSTASLLTELRSVARAAPAPRRVFFTDDNVGITRKRLLELTRALKEEDLGLSWRGFIRADSIDEDTAPMMKASGCRECLLGIESGDPDVLRNMNKRLDPEQALRAVTLLDREGINTQCTFVVGFPGETAASVERTAALISSFPHGPSARAMHRYYLFRFQVFPLCPVASPESRERFGLQGLGEAWSHATMNADEAREALRTLFLGVRGPSHVYLELPPPDWPLPAVRRIAELRDAVQKRRLAGDGDGLGELLDAVREVERG